MDIAALDIEIFWQRESHAGNGGGSPGVFGVEALDAFDAGAGILCRHQKEAGATMGVVTSTSHAGRHVVTFEFVEDIAGAANFFKYACGKDILLNFVGI